MLENTVIKLLNKNEFIQNNIRIYQLCNIQAKVTDSYITYSENIINGGFLKQCRMELRVITNSEETRAILEQIILESFDKEEYDLGVIDTENKIHILSTQLVGSGNMYYSNIKKTEQIFTFIIKFKTMKEIEK